MTELKKPVNFHSIAALAGTDELHNKKDTVFVKNTSWTSPAPPRQLTTPTRHRPGFPRELTIVTSTPEQPSIRRVESAAGPGLLAATTTTPDYRPRRPSSSGTCSSHNTSTSSSTAGETEGDTPPGATSRRCSSKKPRTIYKAQQVCVLEQVFAATHYPDAEYVERLAAELNISEGKIKVWFQNKRARWRRRQSRSGDEKNNNDSHLSHDACNTSIGGLPQGLTHGAHQAQGMQTPQGMPRLPGNKPFSPTLPSYHQDQLVPGGMPSYAHLPYPGHAPAYYPGFMPPQVPGLQSLPPAMLLPQEHGAVGQYVSVDAGLGLGLGAGRGMMPPRMSILPAHGGPLHVMAK